MENMLWDDPVWAGNLSQMILCDSSNLTHSVILPYQVGSLAEKVLLINFAECWVDKAGQTAVRLGNRQNFVTVELSHASMFSQPVCHF